MNDVFSAFYGDTQTNRQKKKPRHRHEPVLMAEAMWHAEQDFTCAHCKNHVSSATFLSGVKNRNHCPYCLWSRHLDLDKAGDRMAACKSTMRPVGLTLKQTRNKYAQKLQGELMLVHQCTECEKISINRVAADDDSEAILALLVRFQELGEQMHAKLHSSGIRVLDANEMDLLRQQLYGRA